MNTQEAFNKICDHLMTQKKQATHSGHWGGSCRYRAPDGSKCAVGCLIPDELYTPSMEGQVIDGTLCVGRPALRKLFAEIDESMLENCQTLHDHDTVGNWASGLRVIAQRFSLLIPDSIRG